MKTKKAKRLRMKSTNPQKLDQATTMSRTMLHQITSTKRKKKASSKTLTTN